MVSEIRADYEELESLASRFERQLQGTQQMMQGVYRSFAELLDDGWKGRGSDAFFSEMQGEVLPASQRLQDALEQAGRVTRAIIEIIRQGEEEACSPFRNGR
jgi:WXG100 family type VII secretion target